MDFSQCSCSGKNLARLLQPAVMSALAQKARHGYVLLQALEGMAIFHGQPPDASGTYKLLKDMERRGFVTSSWELTDSGPAKRLYSLTKNGKACLRQWIETLEEYRDGLNDLIETAKETVEGEPLAQKPDRPRPEEIDR